MNGGANTIETQYADTFREKRRHERYPVSARINLAIEDESRGEPVGIAEAVDICLGGVRMHRLPARAAIEVGSRLQLLLIDADHMLSLSGEVVHDDAARGVGIKFAGLSAVERRDVSNLLSSLTA